MSCTFLCNDCGCIYRVGPNNLTYFNSWPCYKCGSKNYVHRPDLRGQIMFDIAGKCVKCSLHHDDCACVREVVI